MLNIHRTFPCVIHQLHIYMTLLSFIIVFIAEICFPYIILPSTPSKKRYEGRKEEPVSDELPLTRWIRGTIECFSLFSMIEGWWRLTRTNQNNRRSRFIGPCDYAANQIKKVTGIIEVRKEQEKATLSIRVHIVTFCPLSSLLNVPYSSSEIFISLHSKPF